MKLVKTTGLQLSAPTQLVLGDVLFFPPPSIYTIPCVVITIVESNEYYH
jgi:hypothetical protein